MNLNTKLMAVFTKVNSIFIERLGKRLEMLGMKMSAYTILSHLNTHKKEKTQTLGKVASITSGTITHVVSKMIEKGLVKKNQDKNDKRVYWVEITDFGREIFKSINEEYMIHLNELLCNLDETDKKAFIKQLEHFGEVINEKEKLYETK